MRPLLPVDAAPVATDTEPLVPTAPLVAETTATSPEANEALPPLTRLIAPPAAAVADPPETEISPPLALS